MQQEFVSTSTGEIQHFDVRHYDDLTEKERNLLESEMYLVFCNLCTSPMHKEDHQSYTCRNTTCPNSKMHWRALTPTTLRKASPMPGTACLILPGNSKHTASSHTTTLVGPANMDSATTNSPTSTAPIFSTFLVGCLSWLRDAFVNLGKTPRTTASVLYTFMNWRGKTAWLYTGILLITALTWGFTLLSFWSSAPALLALAGIAYTLGLRHAIDGDQLIAVDGVTRSLLQKRKHPETIGLFFSLGQASIVFVWSVLLALSHIALQANTPTLEQVGGLVGTAVSGLFLLLVAILNAPLLWNSIRHIPGGQDGLAAPLSEHLPKDTSPLGRAWHSVFKLVDQNWKMAAVGAIFGLSFDTASAVGHLSVAAVSAEKGVSLFPFLVFPFLFAEGLALAAMTNNIAMMRIYEWNAPRRSQNTAYAITMGVLTVGAAVVIGGAEILSLINVRLGLTGGIWDFANFLDVGSLGVRILLAFFAVFLVNWIAVRITRKGQQENGDTSDPQVSERVDEL
jgi:high-affinity nickel-transport protein